MNIKTPSMNDSDSIIDDNMSQKDFTKDTQYMKGAAISKELTERLLSSENKNPRSVPPSIQTFVDPLSASKTGWLCEKQK